MRTREHEDVADRALTGVVLTIGGDRHLVSGLLNTGALVRVMAPDPTSACDLPEGAEFIQGDPFNPDSLEVGMYGVEAVFLAWPYDRRAARFAAAEFAPAVIDGVAKHARRIVFLSSHGVRDHSEELAGAANGFYTRLERLIERSGLVWTFLRLCMPASITLNWSAQIRAEGVVRGPYAASARTLIDERDIAAVAVRALTEEGHGGAKYMLSGPESLTHAEQVQTIGEMLGRPLRFQESSRDAAREQMLATWTPEHADGVLDAMAARVERPETVSPAVQVITGRPPLTFRDWVIDHAEEFR